jgi:hypothetical protein
MTIATDPNEESQPLYNCCEQFGYLYQKMSHKYISVQKLGRYTPSFTIPRLQAQAYKILYRN